MAEDTTTTTTGGPADDGDLTRGEFLTKATVGVGALVGAMIGVPVAGMALAPAVSGRKFEDIVVGKVADFKEGEYTKVVIEPNPDTPDGYVTQRVAFVRKNASNFEDKLTGEKGGFTIVSNRCVHLGCPVTQSGSGDTASFTCPCHGGSYDQDGDRQAGPPVRPLDRFSYREDNGELIVTGEYSLTPDGNKSKNPLGGKKDQLRGPGQHTGGPESLFYPLQP